MDYNSDANKRRAWRCNTGQPKYCVNTQGRDKMNAIFQTTFSNVFYWMKIYEFRLKFHWNLFLRVKLTIIHHWFSSWLGAVQATNHYLNRWCLDYWRIYESLGPDELRLCKKYTNKKRVMWKNTKRNNICNLAGFLYLYFFLGEFMSGLPRWQQDMDTPSALWRL